VTRATRTVPRLALGKSDAAQSLGVSVDHLERHVLPHVRVVYCGSRRLIPVAELEQFLRSQAIPPVTGTVERAESPANGRVRASRGPVGRAV
jgi:hypothetical protein